MKRANAIIAVLMLSISSGCATIRHNKNLILSTGTGGLLGGLGGSVFSPNDESRGLNALVFGLSGALLGAGVSLILDRNTNPEHPPTELKELDRKPVDAVLYQIDPAKKLPEFLKDRVQSLVIEEYTEADQVTPDGTLHEPHKAYRIRRRGELFSRPINAASAKENQQ